MSVLAVLALGSCCLVSRPDDAAVRAAIVALQQKGDPGWRGVGLVPLDKSAAPALVRLLPSIETPWVLEAVAQQLVWWKYEGSIHALVQTLNRPIWLGGQRRHAAEPALELWGWIAHSELLRGARDGPYQQRLLCSKVLAGQCRARPEDRRFTELFLSMSHSPSTDFKRVAIGALYNLSGRIVSWMEAVHPATMDNPTAFERLLTMAQDDDPDIAREAAVAAGTWLGSHVNGVPDVPQPHRALKREERKALGGVFLRSSSPFERGAAVAMLSFGMRWQSLDGETTVVAALNDGAPMVRRVALACFRARITPEMIAKIAEALPQFNAAGRAAAAEALGFSYLGAALEVLRPLRLDPSAAVREAASKAVDRIEGKQLPPARESHAGKLLQIGCVRADGVKVRLPVLGVDKCDQARRDKDRARAAATSTILGHLCDLGANGDSF